MAQNITDNYLLNAAKNLDDKTGVLKSGVWSPYDNVSEFLARFPNVNSRAEGQFFWVRSPTDSNKADLYTVAKDKSTYKVQADVDLSAYSTTVQVEGLIEAAVTPVQEQVDELNDDLIQEIEDRQNGDETNALAISNEVSRATAAETALQDQLNDKANKSDIVTDTVIQYGDPNLSGSTYTNISLANKTVQLSYEDENGAHLPFITFNEFGVSVLPIVPQEGFKAVIRGESGIMDLDSTIASEAEAIQLLRIHNPSLIFQGFVKPSTPTPLSHVINNAWVVIVSGNVFGVPSVKGQIIYSNGSEYISEFIKLGNIEETHGKNYFDFYNNIIDGLYIIRTPVEYHLFPTVNAGVSSIIKVKPNTKYKITAPHSPNVEYIEYDKNQNWVFGGRQYTGYITTGLSTEYLQIALYTASTKAAFYANNNTQIEEGEVATNVESYIPSLKLGGQDLSVSKLYKPTVQIEDTGGDAVLKKSSINDLISTRLLNITEKEIVVDGLSENKLIKNYFKQPTEAGFSTQFDSSSQLTIISVANDGTLPYSNSELSHFLRCTYDGSISLNTQISKTFIGNTDWKYLTGIWLRKIDIEGLPSGLEFFYSENGEWVTIAKDNLLNVGYQQIYSSGVRRLVFNIVSEVNGWIFLSVTRYNTDRTITNANKWFYFKITTTTSSTGKLDMCNMMLISGNSNSPISQVLYRPYEIYISSGDTIGYDPTFEGKVLNITGGGDDPSVDLDIEKYVYGAKIQNFLSKARDYKYGRWNAKAPKVVLIGDSIFGGTWTATFKAMLNTNFGIPLDNIEIHWYGGGTIDYMLPFLEDISIYPNPDLVIFGEYENMTTGYQVLIESYIASLRRFTSADVMIVTWSMARETADLVWNSGNPNASLAYADAGYTDFHWYRDLARKYNCELMDSNQAIMNYIAAGNSPASFYSTGPHLANYEVVFTPELNKHFNETNWNETVNNTNGDIKSQEVIAATESLFDGFGTKFSFSDKSKWTIQSNRSIRCSTSGESLEISLKDSIGFNILSVIKSSGTVNIQIKKDGGSYALPSALINNGKPLQYATEIRCISYPSDDQWRLKRPFKKAVITSNILADGVLSSGQYIIRTVSIGGIVGIDNVNKWIEILYDWSTTFISGYSIKINGSTDNDANYTVASSSYNPVTNRTRIIVAENIPNPTADGYVINGINNRQYPTCTLFDPLLVELSTFNFGEEVSVLSGALTFPLRYNGSNNYYITAATLDDWGQPANANWVVGDEYEFYIKSNWIDNALMTSNFNRVFGYERGNYTIKLTVNASTTFDLLALTNIKTLL